MAHVIALDQSRGRSSYKMSHMSTIYYSEPQWVEERLKFLVRVGVCEGLGGCGQLHRRKLTSGYSPLKLQSWSCDRIRKLSCRQLCREENNQPWTIHLDLQKKTKCTNTRSACEGQGVTCSVSRRLSDHSPLILRNRFFSQSIWPWMN